MSIFRSLVCRVAPLVIREPSMHFDHGFKEMQPATAGEVMVKTQEDGRDP